MASSSGYNNSDVVIVAAGRTPIGNLNGCLSSLKGHELGAMVIRDVLARGNVPPSDVAEVIMGQVCTAGRYCKAPFSWKEDDPSARIILVLGSSERDMFSAFSLHAKGCIWP